MPRPNSMIYAQEYIWGCEVNAEKKEYTWNTELDGAHAINEGLLDSFKCSLLLKHAVLGVSAVDNELNVVELELKDFFSNELKHPLVRLIAGKEEKCSLDLMLSGSECKLRLIKGTGPVHFWGQLLVDLEDDESEDDNDNDSGTVSAPANNTNAYMMPDEDMDDSDRVTDEDDSEESDPSSDDEGSEERLEIGKVIKPIKKTAFKESNDSAKKNKSNDPETSKKRERAKDVTKSKDLPLVQSKLSAKSPKCKTEPDNSDDEDGDHLSRSSMEALSAKTKKARRS